MGGATASSAAQGPKGEQGTRIRTRAFLAAVEGKDRRTVERMLDDRAELFAPLSLSGDRDDAARFEGRREVLGYLDGVFQAMGSIRFSDVEVNVTENGRTSFVQADGDFTTADGRPYENAYMFRLDWKHGRLTHITEYANPITYCRIFQAPGCA